MGLWQGKGKMGVKNFSLHLFELLIWVYPENLVRIRLLVKELEKGGRMGALVGQLQNNLEKNLKFG